MGHSESEIRRPKERHPWNVGPDRGTRTRTEAAAGLAIRFWLERERRLRDRAMFDLAIDSKLRGCDVKLGDLVGGDGYAHARSLSSRRSVAPFISSSPSPPASAFWRGSNTEAGRAEEFVVPPVFVATGPSVLRAALDITKTLPQGGGGRRARQPPDERAG